MKASPWPLWIAHRGAGKLAPENTLAAFRLGAAHGYSAFECDVKLSADGVPFLLHDATLDRTSNGRSVASQRNWTELSRLDAGSWHSRAYAGEPLASFDAITAFCLGNGHALNVEIKPTPGDERRTGEVVAAEAARRWAGHAVPPRRRSCRARCCSTACTAAGSSRRSSSAAWPWWPTSTSTAARWSSACTAPASGRWPTPSTTSHPRAGCSAWAWTD